MPKQGLTMGLKPIALDAGVVFDVLSQRHDRGGANIVALIPAQPASARNSAAIRTIAAVRL